MTKSLKNFFEKEKILEMFTYKNIILLYKRVISIFHPKLEKSTSLCQIDLDINKINKITTDTEIGGGKFQESSSRIVEIDKTNKYDVIVNLDRPEYTGIRVKTFTNYEWFKDFEHQRKFQDLKKKLIGTFYYIVYNSPQYSKNFFIYGDSAMNLYMKSDIYEIDFRCLNLSRDQIKSMVEKFRDIIETKEDWSIRVKTEIRETDDRICLTVSFIYTFVERYNIINKTYSVNIKFDTNFYSNLIQLYSDRIDCNCITWDGWNFYFNSRFERFMKLRSVIYYPNNDNLLTDIEQLSCCIFRGYAVLTPKLDYDKLKTFTDDNCIYLNEIESILYKALKAI